MDEEKDVVDDGEMPETPAEEEEEKEEE